MAERDLHEAAGHWPYRPWCEDCVRGRAVGPNAKRVLADKKSSEVPRAHLDYAYLQEETIEEEEEMSIGTVVTASMTILVMIETLCRSVWTYAVHAKGTSQDHWLPGKIADDLATVGVGASRVVLKTDTEAAIVELRRAIGRSRGESPTGYDDSKVGDSNSNALVERTIREVKGVVRTIRASLQRHLKADVKLDDTIVLWIVRHAGYVLTRCRVHDCGRTSLHKMKGQKTHAPMIAFGEAVCLKCQ